MQGYLHINHVNEKSYEEITNTYTSNKYKDADKHSASSVTPADS